MKFSIKKTMAVMLALFGVVTTSYAAVGFLTGEQTNGMNKICYYNVLGSTYTLNIPVSSVCPVTHNF